MRAQVRRYLPPGSLTFQDPVTCLCISAKRLIVAPNMHVRRGQVNTGFVLAEVEVDIEFVESIERIYTAQEKLERQLSSKHRELWTALHA